MTKRGGLCRSAPTAVLVATLFLFDLSSNAAASGNKGEIDTATLSSALASALGGTANIKKIRTLYFEFNALSVHATPPGEIQTFQTRMHLEGKEWLTADGEDRAEIRSADMQAPPSLEVFAAGQQSVSVRVTVTNSTRYVPVGGARTCSGPAAGALCANVPALYFDKVSPTVPPRAILRANEANFSGTMIESDTCGGIAAVTPASGKGPQFAFTVAPLHAGECSIRIASNAPQGWMLVGDQGVPSGNSSGQMQGPDLAREISHVYWTTFAYLTSSGLAGKVTYKPQKGASEYLLEMDPEGGKPIEAYLDQKTFLPNKIQIGNDPYKMVIVPKDWRSVGGVRFPFDTTVELFDSQMALHYAFTKIQLNVNPPKNAFKQPTPAL